MTGQQLQVRVLWGDGTQGPWTRTHATLRDGQLWCTVPTAGRAGEVRGIELRTPQRTWPAALQRVHVKATDTLRIPLHLDV